MRLSAAMRPADLVAAIEALDDLHAQAVDADRFDVAAAVSAAQLALHDARRLVLAEGRLVG